LRWLTGQRILLAQRLLEETGEGVDQVASRAGFGNAVAFRHHFRAWLGTTPAAYRSTFRAGAAGAGRPGRGAGGPRGLGRVPGRAHR
jgi:transcriptional regulator GlxA family with amidase domain